MPECDDFQAKECHQGNQEFSVKAILGQKIIFHLGHLKKQQACQNRF
jgi:hypothetical protein